MKKGAGRHYALGKRCPGEPVRRRYVLAVPTDEMVERAALVRARFDGYAGSAIPGGSLGAAYRAEARAILAAALSTSSEEATHG